MRKLLLPEEIIVAILGHDVPTGALEVQCDAIKCAVVGIPNTTQVPGSGPGGTGKVWGGGGGIHIKWVMGGGGGGGRKREKVKQTLK